MLLRLQSRAAINKGFTQEMSINLQNTKQIYHRLKVYNIEIVLSIQQKHIKLKSNSQVKIARTTKKVNLEKMLYHVNSPYYRQFLVMTGSKRAQKSVQGQNDTTATENRGNVNPSSVGV
ncbi:hypothetical protein ABPG72_002203 [Tetrahymena utriculariae]